MARRKRTKKHYADNPRVRRKWGEAKNINVSQRWEREYAGIRKVPKRKKKTAKRKTKRGRKSFWRRF